MKRAWLLVALVGCKHHDVVEHEGHLAGITVEAVLPGASATTMASTVTTPLERQFGQIAHLERLESHSTSGATKLILEFADGTAIDQAEADVQKAINAASNLLPRDLPAPPIYMKVGREGAVLRVVLHGAAWPELSKAADLIAQKLGQVAGVGRVAICGEEKPREHVVVDPLSLANQGKTLDDVVNELRDAGTVDLASLPLTRAVGTLEHDTVRPTCFAFTSQRVVAVTVTPQPGADLESTRDRLESVLHLLTAKVSASIVVETLPRTRPEAFELHLNPEETPERRNADVQALISELPHELAVQAFAELGANDPDTVDLRIVPAGDRDELAKAVQRIAVVHAFDLADRHDHVVGLSGADPVALAAQLDTIVKALASHKALRVSPIGARQTPTMQIVLDRDVMAQLGIAASAVDTILPALVEPGLQVSTLFTQLDQVPVILSVRADDLGQALDRVYMRAATGTLVPLSAIATVTRSSEPTEIIHEGQFPWLGVRVAGPLDEIEAVLATLPTTPDIHRELREPR